MDNRKNVMIKFEGKIFIKDFYKCICKENTENGYILKCKIKERGFHEYEYIPSEGVLTKYPGSQSFTLGKKAKRKIDKAVEKMTDAIDKLAGVFDAIETDKKESYVYYARKGFVYDCIIDCIKDETRRLIFIKQKRLIDVLRAIPELSYYSGKKCDEKELEKNPLFVAAKNKSDMRLKKRLKKIYGIKIVKKRNFSNKRILPKLGEDYDKDYIVDSDTIDLRLLYRSGYTILHRPYFAMKDSTHALWRLNPHQMNSVDAAIEKSESIAFCDYLALFEDNRNNIE